VALSVAATPRAAPATINAPAATAAMPRHPGFPPAHRRWAPMPASIAANMAAK
jgi:hypothetical protein